MTESIQATKDMIQDSPGSRAVLHKFKTWIPVNAFLRLRSEEDSERLICAYDENSQRSISLFIHPDQASFYFNLKGVFKIDHPIKKRYSVDIEGVYSLGSLLWRISKAYQKIEIEEIQKPGKHGWQDPDLSGLVFDEITIYDDGSADVYVNDLILTKQ